jgi:hypothetical protein
VSATSVPPTGWDYEAIPDAEPDIAPIPVSPDVAKAELGDAIILPSGNVTLTDTAETLFGRIARRKGLFYRGGSVVELIPNDVGEITISVLKASAARSRFEKYGRLMKWVVHHNSPQLVLKPVPTIPKELTEALLDSEEAARLLPMISGLLNCPIAVETSGSELRVITPGYDAQTGLLITGGRTPPDVPLDEATASLNSLLEDFDFATLSDHSRAIASMLTPALKAGGHIRDMVPADVAEADQSQSGKTYRQKVNAAIYNERPSMVTCKSGGVGSIDETFNEQLVSGRPFVLFDNFRGAFDSRHLEAFLTCDSLFPARVPHRGKIDIDPNCFFIGFTSNGVDLKPDMANRSNIISIRKKVSDFEFRQFPGPSGPLDLLDYVRANQAYFLGCVFSIVREWIRRGKQRTHETRHDRREWCQVLDWIVQNIFALDPLMGGHREAQLRVSSPELVFLRKLCLAVQTNDRLNRILKAADFLELCEVSDLEVPGVSPERRDDDEYCLKILGSVLSRLFRNRANSGGIIDIDGFQVQRDEEDVVREDGKGTFRSRSYTVTAPATHVDVNDPGR